MKISVIGISGSGKSTLSRELAKQTQLPLFYMDQLFWKGNWQEVPEEEYLKKHQELIKQKQWIIEGYIDAKMADRLAESDLVIFLDYPGWFCVWRVAKRWLTHRKESRPELPKDAKEKLKLEFLWRVLARKERIPLTAALKLSPPNKMVVISSTAELNTLMKDLHDLLSSSKSRYE
jgi:adenylate kinase family enzyme